MRKYKLAARRNFVFQLILMVLPLTIGIILGITLDNDSPMVISGIITVILLAKLAEYIYLPKIIKTKYGYLYYVLTEEGKTTYIELKKDNIVGWENLVCVDINPEDSRERIVYQVEKRYEKYLKDKEELELEKRKAKAIENKLNNLSDEPNDTLLEELKRIEHE